MQASSKPQRPLTKNRYAEDRAEQRCVACRQSRYAGICSVQRGEPRRGQDDGPNGPYCPSQTLQQQAPREQLFGGRADR